MKNQWLMVVLFGGLFAVNCIRAEPGHSADNPILIAEISDLDAIRNNVGTSSNPVFYKQTLDIDLQGVAWVPINSSTTPSYIHYDGNNHKISNLNISSSDARVGLFGNLAGSVKNLTVVSGTVSGNARVGALVGNLEGGTVSDCAVSNVDVTGNFYVGGLVGWNQGGALQGVSTRDATVMIVNSTGGGLVGNNSGTIVQSFAAVHVIGSSNAGGLIGTTGTGGNNVSDSYWDRDIKELSAGGSGATGLSTAAMQQRGSFPGWDFDSVWRIYENESYPYLRALADTVDPLIFSPDGGFFTGNSVVVTALCAHAEANIHYVFGIPPEDPYALSTNTINRIDSGGVIEMPIDSVRLTAEAWMAYYNPSKATGLYYPAPQAPIPVADPPAGSYEGDFLSVTLISTNDAVIYYTLDGTMPDDTSTNYVASGESITIPLPTTLQAIAYKPDLNPSYILTAVYTSKPVASAPVFDPDGGIFTNASVIVAVTSATPGAIIYYTTDGSVPDGSKAVEGGVVDMPIPGTLRAFARKEGYVDSAQTVATFDEAGAVGNPVFDPGGGPVNAGFIRVTITNTTPGSVIRYTTDGMVPTTNSHAVVHGEPVVMPVPGVLKAKAWDAAEIMSPSGVTSNSYSTADVFGPPPIFSPNSEAGLAGAIPVLISHSETSGVTIHYTLNGKDPTSFDPYVYPGDEIHVPLPSILKARAVKAGLFPSPVAIGYYGDFAGGDGSEENPYLIASPEHLDSVRDHLHAHFLMISDIDLGIENWGSGPGWLPIGNSTDRFAGVLDGGGHLITNLTISRPSSSFVGLFGRTASSARIMNLGVASTKILGEAYVGGIVGANDGVISNVYSVGSVTATNMGAYAGGIAGATFDGSLLSDAYVHGSVQGQSMVGGLVGFVGGPTTISRAYSTASITAGSSAGGIVGRVENLFGQLILTETLSYWDTQSSGVAGSAGGSTGGRTTQQMQDPATFTGWDTNAVWQVQLGAYPQLLIFVPAQHPVPPDEWLTRFYGAVAAAPERSKKNLLLWEEYVAGTDPTDPASVFKVTETDRSGDFLELVFPSVLGRRYRVAVLEDLLQGGWQVLESVPPQPGNGGLLLFEVPLSGSKGYYRLLVELDE